MADINISKYTTQVLRVGSTPASPGFAVSEGQNPVDPSGNPQTHLPVTIATATTGLSITESQILSGAGLVSQYIRGDGSLADFPATTGGGSSVSYYLNGSVSQGTIGGVAYKQLNKTPVFGAGTDFSIGADGYIASFITDASDPNKLLIPAGNWNFETYFSASSSGGSPSFYVELYKYDGTTFTLIATSSSAPELIAFGTSLNPYYSTLAVPQTTLALTDRLAIRYYVTHSGRTITLHTEDNHLCQIITTFTTGITALNGLTAQVQNFAVGTSGTDFAISSATATHTFNLPTASATNRGALSSADWTTFNGKENAITAGTTLQYFRGDKTFQTLNTAIVPELTNLYYTEARVNANTNVAANTAARHNAVTLGTANGLSLSTQILSLGLASAGVTGALSGTDWTTFNNKTSNLGTVTSVGLSSATSGVTIGSTPVTTSGTITLAIATASGSQNGLLSSTDWTTFNSKQNAITLTTTGTSGAATLVGATLNIPSYTDSFVGTVTSVAATAGTGISVSGSPITTSGTLTITNTAPDQVVALTASTGIAISGTYPNFTITNTSPSSGGTVTSVTASSPLFSSGGTTPNLTIQQASGSQNGFLSSTDWTTFNNKAPSVAGGYLPLSGGTLTGALNGTSATFSSTITANGGNILSSGATYGIVQVKGSGASTWQMFANPSDEMRFGRSGVGDYLTIANTGAATFSSSVTAGTDVTLNNGILYVSAGSGTSYSGRLSTAYIYPYITTYLDSFAGAGWEGRLQFRTNSAGGAMNTQLTILNSGAATFSSSVIARSYGINNAGFRGGLYAYVDVTGSGSDNSPTIFAEGGLNQGNIYFCPNGSATRAMTINTSSNVLIGTTTDNGARLQVQGSTGVIANFLGTGGRYGQIYSDANAAVFGASTSASLGTSYMYINPSSNFMAFVTNSSENLRITSSGNVGIGTATPVDALVVSGENKLISFEPAGDASFCGIRWSKNTAGGNVTAASIIGTTEGNFGRRGIAFSTGNFADFTTNAVERMRITSGGNVLIGTTTDSAGRLRVKASGNDTYAIAFERSNTTTTLGGFYQNSGSSGELFLRASNGSDNVKISSTQFSYWAAPTMNFAIGTAIDSTDKLRVNGTTFTNEIMTWNPENDNRSGVAWRLGAASIASITPNRRLRVNVGGIEYYIGAVEV